MKSLLFFSLFTYAAAINYDGCGKNLYNAHKSQCLWGQTPFYSVKNETHNGYVFHALYYDDEDVDNVCTDDTKYCDVYKKSIISLVLPAHGYDDHVDSCTPGTYLQKNTPIVYSDQINNHKMNLYTKSNNEGDILHDTENFVQTWY